MDASTLSAELKKSRMEELQLDKVEAVVQQFQVDVEKDMKVKDGLRTVSRDLEKGTKQVVHGIQRIHIDADCDEKVTAIGKKALELIQTKIVPIIELTKDKMPTGEYFKYAEFIRSHITRTVFAIGVSQFLIDGAFVTIETMSQLLKLPTLENRESSTVFLEWEQYLEGMIDVGQELARLAKNCVILDNFGLVGRIHKFISTLNYGFSGMNFKNDSLRRKYDSLKYDARAIEEVVYDLRMQQKKDSTEAPIPSTST